MSRLPGQDEIADGISPRAAVGVLARIRDAMRHLEAATSRICAAYDGELHRCYGHDFCLPMEDSQRKLAEARAAWGEAMAEFQRFVAPDHLAALEREEEQSHGR